MIDFVEEIIKKQEELGYTDKEVSTKSGIGEYIYYDIKKYRTYLTKLSYISLCVVMGIGIQNEEEIENILENNKKKVGSPDTNIKLAANVANPEYVRKLEKEIITLQKVKDRLASNNELILRLKKEKREVEEKLKEIENSDKEQEKTKYQEIVKEVSKKIKRVKEQEVEKKFKHIIEEQEKKIDNLDRAVRKTDKLYYEFFMDVFNKDSETVNGYPIPRLATSNERMDIYKKLEGKNNIQKQK